MWPQLQVRPWYLALSSALWRRGLLGPSSRHKEPWHGSAQCFVSTFRLGYIRPPGRQLSLPSSYVNYYNSNWNETRVRSRFHNANRSPETAHGETLPIFIEKITMPLDLFVVLATCQLLRVIPGEPFSEFRGLVMATHKCEVWSLGNPAAAAAELAETLGMKHAA
jgi:hypothetical protein